MHMMHLSWGWDLECSKEGLTQDHVVTQSSQELKATYFLSCSLPAPSHYRRTTHRHQLWGSCAESTGSNMQELLGNWQFHVVASVAQTSYSLGMRVSEFFLLKNPDSPGLVLLFVCELHMYVLKPFSEMSSRKTEIIKIISKAHYVRHCVKHFIYSFMWAMIWLTWLKQASQCVNQDFTGFPQASFSTLVDHETWFNVGHPDCPSSVG